jgi:hypothetical protein
MLRARRGDATPPLPRPHANLRLAAEGLVVGVVTGMVGAGGGFLVVPALALLVGLPMHAAIGTSLLIIAMKSFAGLGGHLSHAQIDLGFAAVVTGFAVVGSIGGAALGARLRPERLRKLFAGFVLAMAAFMLYREAPLALRETLLVARWPFWAGGAAIGGFVVLLLLAAGKPLGVSSGFADACAAVTDPGARRSWRLPFLAGIVFGGLAAALLAGTTPTLAMGMFDRIVTSSLPVKAALFTAGGVLIGFGTRLAGGCTSGHGIVGTAQLARSSLVATATFMATGFAVTQLVLVVLFGAGGLG